MKPFLSILLFFISVGSFKLQAQTIYLKDGQVIENIDGLKEFDQIFLYDRNSRSISIAKDRIQKVIDANGNTVYEFLLQTMEEFEASDGIQAFGFQVNGESIGSGRWIKEGQFQILSGSIPDGIYEEFYPSGRIKRTYQIQNGQLNGICKEHYASGVVERESTMVNGLENGVSKNYHQDGTLEGEANFVNGQKEGETRLYYESGAVSNIMTFSNGMLNGTVQVFYESGAIHTEVDFVDDQRHGIIKQFYETGAEMMMGTYNRGKLEGEVVIYYESGRVKKRQTFRNGRILNS